MRSTREPAAAAGARSKFITYFQLLDLFRQDGCPVCRHLEHAARRALDGLLYEQVNDPILRARLAESHGFCNWHAWMLPGVSNGASGVAIIGRELLANAVDQVEASRAALRPRSLLERLRDRVRGAAELPLLRWRREKQRCFLCDWGSGPSDMICWRSSSSSRTRASAKPTPAPRVSACPTSRPPRRPAATTRTSAACWPTTRAAGGIWAGSWRSSRESSTTATATRDGGGRAVAGSGRWRRSPAGTCGHA